MDILAARDSVGGPLVDALPGALVERPGLHFEFEFEFRDASGLLIARRRCRNLVTTVGKNHLINVEFRGSTQSTAWYVGLKGTGSAAASDTSASHAGWSEITAYSQSTRQALTLAAASGGSSNNSASPAVFTINASATIAGAFIIDNSTKGGTTGALFNAADFSAPVTLSAGTVTVNGIALSL